MGRDVVGVDDHSPSDALEAIFQHGNRFVYKPGEPYRRGPNWFLTGDGSRISVIAGWGTYCSPRPEPVAWGGAGEDYPGPFYGVGAWLPGDDDPELIGVGELRRWIAEHGGLVAGPAESEKALKRP